LAAKADQPLGTDQSLGIPQLAPDGTTPLHIVADGTATGTLVGGSRYVGWLQNPAQGVLFDRVTRQSWYIYCQFGEPGSGRMTWYAQDLHKPMPDWVDATWPRN
jgi:hypothetical protein